MSLLGGRRSTPLPTSMPQGVGGPHRAGVYTKPEPSLVSFFTNPLNQSIQCWCFALVIAAALMGGVILFVIPFANQDNPSFSASAPPLKAQYTTMEMQRQHQEKVDQLQQQINDLRNSNAALKVDVRSKQQTIDQQGQELDAIKQRLQQQQGQRQGIDAEKRIDVNAQDSSAQGRQQLQGDALQQVVFVKDFTRSEGVWEICADPDCLQKIEEPFVFRDSHQFTFRSPRHSQGALVLFEHACPADPVLQCQNNIVDGKVTYNFTMKEAVFALCYCSATTQNQPYENHGTIHVAAAPQDQNAMQKPLGKHREI